MKKILLSLLTILFALPICAEDGHALWLRNQPVNKAKVTTNLSTPTALLAKQELETYYRGEHIALKLDSSMPDDDGYRFDVWCIRSVAWRYEDGVASSLLAPSPKPLG